MEILQADSQDGLRLEHSEDTTVRGRLVIKRKWPVLALIIGVGIGQIRCQRLGAGKLELSVVDEATGQPTPARVELVDANGKAYVASDALLVDGSCEDPETPSRPSLQQALSGLTRSVENPYTKSVQFYSSGASEVSVPAGDFSMRVYKGTEYRMVEQKIELKAGERKPLRVKMSRWVNLPAQGWYSADDHLHIARPIAELNPYIAKWMQAEDLHVANLLQFGLARRFHNPPQYGFGPPSVYREGDYLVVSGQENPRTHFLGHTIVLGANSQIHFPDEYLIYRMVWEEAARQGAVSGYAHFGSVAGGQYGLAIDLPRGLLNFVEVMQNNHGGYGVWYDILNTGFRLTPTAGTDYPCIPSIPGRERFYTKVDGSFTYENWLEGIRRGRTFVTLGPVLEFHVAGKGMGEEVELKTAAPVTIEGRVSFDPQRDSVTRLDLIENGELLRSFPRLGNSAEISFKISHEVKESGWYALQAAGDKLGEALWSYDISLAHSAPVFARVQSASKMARMKVLARKWLALLENLEARLAEGQVAYLAADAASNPGDLDAEYIRRNRAALVEAIHEAREHFTKLAR